MKGIAALVPVTVHPDKVPPLYQTHYHSYTENAEGVPILGKKEMMNYFKYADVSPDDESCFVLLPGEEHKNLPPT